ncbi:type VI secretion system protein TssL, long form [Methylobacterium sp. NEAU 140]|uniref:type VI secretion system protein TssL, long form n=1 Tax=Methylobacterium sp. NEAU 140 TaxID=3064945 RepID=UPI002733B457|nr:type VI secretion system protein TssL, long form [Methylobacterium sp. NEAU 140]MDP4024935.1 type VI secretion system protein TssL, long form [Methylobacterium sp. NEAU 140]
MNDPFGRRDRTIILPDPGGRRLPPEPPRWSAPPAAPPPPPLSSHPSSPPPSSPPPAGQDDWADSDVSARNRAAAAAAAVRAERRQVLVMKRDVVTAPNANPFLRASAPLLLLLGRLRVQLSTASFSNLMEQVAASIEDFEKDTRGAGVSAEQMRAAKYIVCATADDIVQNIPTDERHVWTQYSMLSRFFGERIGGVRFFEELERAKIDPSGNYHLLELIHACLGIGFQGVHRTSGGGAASLQQIQRNLYELLRRTRPVEREVSPRWQGQSLLPEALRSQVPLWATAAVVAAALLGLFLLLRTLLTGNAEAVASDLVALHPTSEIGIQRRVYAPPPPPPPPPPASQAGQFQEALKAEIANNAISVIESGNQITLRVAAALFPPADARVKPAYTPLIQRLAALVEKGGGPVKVVGHTDAFPIKTVLFPSNFALSEARAKAVAAVLKAGLSKPERVEIEGKGADVPIASNKTPEGRARNRRVDIVVPRER